MKRAYTKGAVEYKCINPHSPSPNASALSPKAHKAHTFEAEAARRSGEVAEGTDKASESARASYKTERKKQIEIEIVKTNHTQQIRDSAHITVAQPPATESIHTKHFTMKIYQFAYVRSERIRKGTALSRT